MTNAQKKEWAPKTEFQKNKWATKISEIKKACSKRTHEEIRLHECAALTSWERR